MSEDTAKRYHEETHDLSLYKFYLELVFKVAVFSFGITGAMVSYYLSHTGEGSYLRYSLLLPLIMNAGFATVCGLGAPSALRLRDSHKPYELVTLPAVLWIFVALYGLVAIGLIVLLTHEGLAC